MIGIYKYQNKQNGKIYIGRSINITKRKWEHKTNPSPYSYFDQVLKTVGEENFDFEIVEECSESELKDKEKYWINYYNCCVLENREGGYNLTHGGEEYRSDENPWARLTVEQVQEIIDKLAHTKTSMDKLAKEYNVHRNTISDINRCKTWAWLHNYHTNIRKEEQGSVFHGELNGCNKITEEQAKHIIYLLEHDSRSQAQIARDEGIKESRVNDINNCRSWTYLHNYKKNIRKEAKLKK